MTDYATLLRDRVTLTCRCVDRIFLQAYVPNLQTPGLVARFLLGRGFPYPSSAALGKLGDAYVESIHRYAETNDIPVVYFKKGESKEEFVRPYVKAAAEVGEARSCSSASPRRRRRCGDRGRRRAPSTGAAPSRSGDGRWR